MDAIGKRKAQELTQYFLAFGEVFWKVFEFKSERPIIFRLLQFLAEESGYVKFEDILDHLEETRFSPYRIRKAVVELSSRGFVEVQGGAKLNAESMDGNVMLRATNALHRGLGHYVAILTEQLFEGDLRVKILKQAKAPRGAIEINRKIYNFLIRDYRDKWLSLIEDCARVAKETRGLDAKSVRSGFRKQSNCWYVLHVLWHSYLDTNPCRRRLNRDELGFQIHRLSYMTSTEMDKVLRFLTRDCGIVLAHDYPRPRRFELNPDHESCFEQYTSSLAELKKTLARVFQ